MESILTTIEIVLVVLNLQTGISQPVPEGSYCDAYFTTEQSVQQCELNYEEQQ